MKKRKSSKRARAVSRARRGQAEAFKGETPPHTEWEGTEAVPLLKRHDGPPINPSLIAKGKR